MHNFTKLADRQVYKGLEGIRSWLAWPVVLCHIASMSPYALTRTGLFLTKTGDYSVIVFIILSGFVITNLVQTKHEPYGLFITRRALRIYPAYLIGLALSLWELFTHVDIDCFWPMTVRQVQPVIERAVEIQHHLMPHLLLHLSLLHSLAPREVLPQSETILLGPAWSLSLEWQFYLIAPVFIICARKYPTAMAALGLAGFLSFKGHWFGHFYRPGQIFSGAWYFLIGIVTRLYIDDFSQLRRIPWAILLMAVPLIVKSDATLVPCAVWLAMVLYLRSPFRLPALDSRLARAAGERSYSVYILHTPVLYAAIWLVWGRLELSGIGAVGVAAAIAVATTIALSELVYRLIERPAIFWGKSLGKASIDKPFSIAKTGPASAPCG